MRKLEEFLCPSQKGLQSKLRKIFRGNYISCKDEFILVRGEAPVLLVAHMDTVHKVRVKQICATKDRNVLMSPQGIGGDDRCGVYALVSVYEQSEVKPWLLFTCDEEIGGIGAEKFCDHFRLGELPEELLELKMIIEIDRKGRNDAVYYDCENREFEEYITSKGFITNHGSFSDISYIAPELGVAAVNLSSGYYNAHTQHEYINRAEIDATIQKVVEMVVDATAPDFPRYEYVDAMLDGWDMGYGGWDFYSDYYEGLKDRVEKLPAGIQNEYKALLDFYSPGELDLYREVQGDHAIIELFKTEFGSWDGYRQLYGITDMIGMEEEHGDGTDE